MRVVSFFRGRLFLWSRVCIGTLSVHVARRGREVVRDGEASFFLGELLYLCGVCVLKTLLAKLK